MKRTWLQSLGPEFKIILWTSLSMSSNFINMFLMEAIDVDILDAASLSTGVQATDPEIQNAIEFLDFRFREFHILECRICICQNTVVSIVHVILKHYNSQKPTKCGIQIFLITDSSSGYTVNV
jgi:hypothetical protein